MVPRRLVEDPPVPLVNLVADLHEGIHRSGRSNWLRAAVLGANDGILSTSSLVLGVAASGASGPAIVVAGVAGLTAGALSMAAGEYVTVSSQRDSERADLRLEARELADDPRGELLELALIYEDRGLPAGLAREVALALTARDALASHARDELGLVLALGLPEGPWPAETAPLARCGIAAPGRVVGTDAGERRRREPATMFPKVSVDVAGVDKAVREAVGAGG